MSGPNLLRDQFPYTDPPRLLFSPDPVPPLQPAADLFITDTTFRDGQQARPPYTVAQVVHLYDLLHRLAGPRGIIRQSEFFLYSPTDRQAVAACLERGYRFPEVTAWIRAVPQDFDLVKAMGIRETGILTSCSDYHIYLKLGLDRRRAMDQYLGVVRSALAAGVRPRCHLEDVTRADVYGFVVPFVQELMRLAGESGVPIKVRLCDTMGYGVPWAQGALPRGVPRLVRAMIDDAGVPGHLLEWHGHNDFYKVMVNPVTAWLYGCGGANGTLLGFGERTGNTPVEGLVFEYMGLSGDTAVETTVITEAAAYFERELGYQVPPMTPFVGRMFNVTAAGIHADGIIKNPEVYSIFDTERLLGRPPGVSVTDKAGVAGVVFWVRQQTGASLDKRHPGIVALHAWVQEQYRGGRATSLGDRELAAAARQYLPELFAPGAGDPA